jgi:hypothetical protein
MNRITDRIKTYKYAYDLYLKDNKHKDIVYSFEGFCDNVNMYGDDITYKKYFKEYIREQKLERIIK